MQPTFSIIVPVYAAEKYIKQCARTVLGQTYPYIQFIFINDGTQDSSMTLLNKLIDNEFPEKKSQILIINQENQGVAKTRKKGIDLAEGDYILHVDSDDWIELNTVEIIAKKINEHGASDAIFFRFYKEKKSGSKNRGDKKFKLEDKDTYIKNLFCGKSYGYLCVKCFRKEIYDFNKIFLAPYNMIEDLCLVCQLVTHIQSISHIDNALYHYRRTNPNSLSRSRKKMKRERSSMNLMGLYKYYEHDLEHSPIKDVYKRILYQTAWNSIFYKLDLFEKYPFLADKLKQIPISTNNFYPLFKQIIVKLHLFLNK